MLYNERKELILQQVQLKEVVKISDLAVELGMSIDTVRRDLRSMENEGLIKCVRGGACLPDSIESISNFAKREIINVELKREAAKKAMKYIEPDAVIALNSGTTNTILAQELAFRNQRLTIVTNNFAAINILMKNPLISIIAIGGSVDSVEKSTYGIVSESEFAKYIPDVAFLSINAVDFEYGFTDFRYSEMGVIQLLAEKSKKVIAIMDSSKLGKCSKKKVLSADQVDILVMDNNVNEATKTIYKQKGITIE